MITIFFKIIILCCLFLHCAGCNRTVEAIPVDFCFPPEDFPTKSPSEIDEDDIIPAPPGYSN